jgi:hypothetical protein
MKTSDLKWTASDPSNLRFGFIAAHGTVFVPIEAYDILRKTLERITNSADDGGDPHPIYTSANAALRQIRREALGALAATDSFDHPPEDSGQ